MGMEFNYMILSKDRNKLTDLADYIYWRYNQDYEDTDEHKMLGYGIAIFAVGEWHVLAGCHRKCNGSDLGWWLRWDDQSSLVEGVIYLEDHPETTLVWKFKEADNTPLGDCDGVMDYIDEESEVKGDLPEEMIPYIRMYFYHGFTSFAAWVTWREEYVKSGRSRFGQRQEEG